MAPAGGAQERGKAEEGLVIIEAEPPLVCCTKSLICCELLPRCTVLF